MPIGSGSTSAHIASHRLQRSQLLHTCSANFFKHLYNPSQNSQRMSKGTLVTSCSICHTKCRSKVRGHKKILECIIVKASVL